MGASTVQIIDDSGVPVTETQYMPPFSWDAVYYNIGENGLMGGRGSDHRYNLLNARLLNRVAGQRANGCNTNGCCGHDRTWLQELPSRMFLRVTDLAGQPRAGARLDIYRRVGIVDNVIDHTYVTDADGRAELPPDIFWTDMFVLKITSADGQEREYRVVERTNFHLAHWEGQTDSYDYTIRTDFGPVPYVGALPGIRGGRGQTVSLTVRSPDFRPGMSIRFGNPGVTVDDLTLEGEELRVTATLPGDMFRGSVYRIYNPDGKFLRIGNPYDGFVQSVPDNRPFARFVSYRPAGDDGLGVYFNGLWSDDWGRLLTAGGVFPQPGAGPLAS